jgi:hypothetical protein
MITLRRSGERQHDRLRSQEVWRTFTGEARPVEDGGRFGALIAIDEVKLAPSAGVPQHESRGAQIITWVREGSLSYEDSSGRDGLIRAGEFQCMTFGLGVRHREANGSKREPALLLQVWLEQGPHLVPASSAQRRFSVAERHGSLCMVASPDGRKGSLRLSDGALLYSAFLSPGQHLAHELPPGRSAWLHVVRGHLDLNDALLDSGDGAGFSNERVVSVTALEESEVLLIDLGPPGEATPLVAA